MKFLYKITLAVCVVLVGASVLTAGNPDRQGEAGAAELLLNPWAKSSGLHSMNTSTVSGVEAMTLNIAGLTRLVNRKEIIVANTRLYEGSGLKVNALGYGARVGNSGAFGISVMSVDFGDIEETTVDNPGGTGTTFSPSFVNIGIGYSYMYENKISVGFLLRGISESLNNVSAFGFAIDAGVQYISGNFRLGISLKNVGSPMTFSGEGLSTSATLENGVPLNLDQRVQRFELPSVLNMGLSYDFNITEDLLFRTLGNFTSNAFSRDQIGVGAEIEFNEMFTVRAAYKQELSSDSEKENVYTGLAAGISVDLPFNKESANRIGIDYAYRTTSPWRGTHNFSIRLSL